MRKMAIPRAISGATITTESGKVITGGEILIMGGGSVTTGEMVVIILGAMFGITTGGMIRLALSGMVALTTAAIITSRRFAKISKTFAMPERNPRRPVDIAQGLSRAEKRPSGASARYPQ